MSGSNDSPVVCEHADYELLCSLNKEQASKLEALSQEAHTLRNRLQIAEKIHVDYQNELECQQGRLIEVNDCHAITVLKLKEDHALVVKDFEDKVHGLQNGLEEVQLKHASDKEELLKARKELHEIQDSSPVATLKAELQEIMEEHAANRLACIQHQELNKVLLQEKTCLLEELKSTREHLEMTEEKLKICKADLTEQSETLEDLRESLAVAENELACLKTNPPDTGAKGNSLFAEVEDNRQAMLKKCTSLSKKYYDMKRDYGAKCSQISKLKVENLQLRRKWQDEVEDKDNRDVWLDDNYQIRINELTKLVEDLKKEEKPVFINGDSKILTYAEHVVKEARQQLSQLREEMEWRSSQRLNEAKALYMARSDVQILKSQVMSLNAENLVLRDKLDEANITDIPSPGKTLKFIKEALNNANEIPVLSTTKAFSSSSEDTSPCPTSLQTNFPSISSIMVNLPKPLLEAKMKQLDSKGTSTNNGPIEENPIPENDINVSGSEEEGNTCMNEEEKLAVDLSTMCEEDKTTEEYDNLTPSLPNSDLMRIKEKEINPVKVGEVEENLIFISPKLLQPVCAAISEVRKTPQSDEESCNVYPSVSECVDENEPVSTFKKPSIESHANLVEQKNRLPLQSILSAVSRPSLVPIDQNSIIRKVRFADLNASCTSPVESDSETKEVLGESSKKKLTRIPQPKNFKTRIIVSKDLV